MNPMDVIDRNTCTRYTLLFLPLISRILLIHGEISSHADLEILRYLKQINKPAVKTIKSSFGELIDCVDIYKQPAFDHPLLLNHTIQTKPNLSPSNIHIEESSSKIYQAWRENGKCPKGTVPIRRVQKDDLLRASSPQSFGKKEKPYSGFRGHEHSVVLQRGSVYYGAGADINLWNPRVRPSDFSLSQLWIISDENVQNTIEVGVMVFPKLFGDYENRLFIYWTADAYKSKGCYNLLCPGFVQTNNNIAIGARFSSKSIYGGTQYYIKIYVVKDETSGNWWLSILGSWIGYWPNSILPDLQYGAQMIEWGGEVYNADYMQGSTTTEMGSGHFAEEGPRKAACFENIYTVDANRKSNYPTRLEVIVEKPECYNLLAGASSFCYGGPGKSAACP